LFFFHSNSETTNRIVTLIKEHSMVQRTTCFLELKLDVEFFEFQNGDDEYLMKQPANSARPSYAGAHLATDAAAALRQDAQLDVFRFCQHWASA
jgi:hypothetical protein